MNEALIVQGRCLEPADIVRIRGLIAENPTWSRRRLSEALSAEWGWRNGSGRLKDMAARSLLVKLEARGLGHLPGRRQMPSNRMAGRRIPDPACGPAPQTGTPPQAAPLSGR